MESKTIDISIIISARDISYSIINTIDLLKICKLNIEVIIVIYNIDDSNVNNVLNKYSELDRVSVIKSDFPENGYCFNSGIKNARGKYLFFMKSDGYVVEDGLISLFEHAEKHCLDMAIAWVKYIGGNGAYIKPSHFLGKIDSTTFEETPKLIKNIFPFNRIYRKAFLISYNESIFSDFSNYSSDSKPCIYGYYKAKRIGSVDKVVYIESTKRDKYLIENIKESILISKDLDNSLSTLEKETQKKMRKFFFIKELISDIGIYSKTKSFKNEDIKDVKRILIYNFNLLKYLSAGELDFLKNMYHNNLKKRHLIFNLNFSAFKYFFSKKSIIYYNFIKSLLLFNIGFFCSKIFNVNISLIGEREGKTISDNGFAFFKGVGRRLNCYFVTREKNIEEASKHGNVLKYGSIRHLFYVGLARRYFFDVSMLDISPYWRVLNKKPRNSKKLIFLQHGVMALNRTSFYYDHYSMTCRNELPDMLCVSSNFEKNSFISDYSFPEDIIKVTGLSRYDYLPEVTNKQCNNILYIPTWRNWLEHQSLDEFIKSQYYRSIIDLTSKLSKWASENDHQITLVLHHKMSKFEMNVNLPCVSFRYMSDLNWEHMLSTGRLLVTDYSSVVFDFIRLGKPAITYPFDKEAFLAVRGGEMITDKETPFLASCNNSDEVIENIGKIINDKTTYLNDGQVFFDYNDRLNCNRILTMADELDRTEL
ncbi:CDP-glycerol glycerophosphotransferase family protein [Vibrio zhanjiangensis]|nr:CDP-glycerol glycerophosphotransferase family protein [Vibrio zhanjiangensis]